MEIKIWNRKKQSLEVESVYGAEAIEFLYGSSFGFKIADYILAGKILSKCIGAYQSSALSKKKIAPFIEKFQIPKDDFIEPYSSFNDFFIRKFKPGKRHFPSDPICLGAPAEARYLAFQDTNAISYLPIKGLRLEPLSLLGDAPYKERFRGGPCLLARLCPVDYHRFHFPDEGKLVSSKRQIGRLHSVNPLALKAKPDLFLTNERHVSILDTKRFGRMAYVEVGAMCVGRIVQTHKETFSRGEEKGYFLFGASTVILYGEKGAWRPEQDLLEKTAEGIETLVELGSPVGRRLSDSPQI